MCVGRLPWLSSPDGLMLASGGEDNAVFLTHLNDLGSISYGTSDWVASVDFSYDGRYLAAGSYGDYAVILQAETGEHISTGLIIGAGLQM